jgi:hypothetical protein
MAVKKIVKKPEPLKKPDQKSVRVETGEVFIIQKNVPVSGVYRSLGPSIRYPFHEMLPGDSFEMKTNKNEMRRVISRTSSACVSYCRRINNAAKFTVRRTSDETVRVWRLK